MEKPDLSDACQKRTNERSYVIGIASCGGCACVTTVGLFVFVYFHIIQSSWWLVVIVCIMLLIQSFDSASLASSCVITEILELFDIRDFYRYLISFYYAYVYFYLHEFWLFFDLMTIRCVRVNNNCVSVAKQQQANRSWWLVCMCECVFVRCGNFIVIG